MMDVPKGHHSLKKRGIFMTLQRLSGVDPWAVPAITAPKHGVFVGHENGTQNFESGLNSPISSPTSSHPELSFSDTIDFGHVLISEQFPNEENSPKVTNLQSSTEEQQFIPQMYDFEQIRRDVLGKMTRSNHSKGGAKYAKEHNMRSVSTLNVEAQPFLPSSIVRKVVIVNQSHIAIMLKEIVLYPPDPPPKKEKSEILDSGLQPELEKRTEKDQDSGIHKQNFQIRHALRPEWHSGTNEEGIYEVEAVIPPFNQSFSLEIKCEPQNCNGPGFLGRWLLFFLEYPETYDLFDYTVRHFTLGRRLLASATTHFGASALLNSDARPFVPTALRQIFHQPVPTLSVQKNNLARGQTKLFPFRPKILEINSLPEYAVDKSIWKAFTTALEENRQLEARDHGAFHQFASNNPIDLEDHLRRLGLLLMLEECQMANDIRHYDLFDHQVELECKTILGGEVGAFGCLTVPGANENRPKVTYGDIVRLRQVTTHYQKHYEMMPKLLSGSTPCLPT